MKTGWAVLRLFLIQIFAFCAVSLSTFFPGWDLLLSILYLVVLIGEGRIQSSMTIKQKLATVILWQGPALIFSIYVFAGLTVANLDDYAIFILQFWTAPMLPWWSLLNAPLAGDYPLYYYYVLASPLLFMLCYLLAAIPKKSVGASGIKESLSKRPTFINKNQE